MKFVKVFAVLMSLAASIAVVAGEKQTDSPSEVIRKRTEATKNVDYAALAALSCGSSKVKMQMAADKLAAIEKAARSGDANAVRISEHIQRRLTQVKAALMLACIQKQLTQARIALKDLKIECTGEKIEGDFAEVHVTISGDPTGHNGTGILHLKKVDGEWKYITPMDYINEAGSRNK